MVVPVTPAHTATSKHVTAHNSAWDITVHILLMGSCFGGSNIKLKGFLFTSVIIDQILTPTLS